MSKAILLKSDDWEGLYVDGKLIEEGHTLNQGYCRIKYFAGLADQYNFRLSEMVSMHLDNDDIEMTEDIGCFPKNIVDFKNEYPGGERPD